MDRDDEKSTQDDHSSDATSGTSSEDSPAAPENGGPKHADRAVEYAQAIVGTIREGLLVLTTDLIVKSANKAFYQMYGGTPDDTRGHYVYDLGNGQWDIPALRELLENILPEEKTFVDFVVEHEFEDLGPRMMLLNARQLDEHDLILLAIEDVTERRNHQRRFRLLADAMPQLVWMARPDGTVDYYNRRAAAYEGLSRENDDKWQWAPVLHPDDRERTEAAWAAAVEDEEFYEVEHRVRTVHGYYRWHLSRAVPVRDDRGDLVRWYGTATDIHGQKMAEEELNAFNKTLEERVEERTRQVRELASAVTMAEQKERQRIAQVLHDDLQQHLYGLGMTLTLAARASAPEERDSLYAQARHIVEKATELTRTLSTELSPPILQGEDLGQTFDWLGVRMKQQHGLHVELDIGPECRIPSADLRILLYQILRELLFNVVKHADTQRVEVRAREEGGNVVVEVEDRGSGFEVDTVEASATSEGFGLPTVRERLELVGGRFELESTPGEGTTATVVVPIEEANWA